MNKNQKNIISALENNIFLKTLKLSTDYKNFEIQDHEIQDLDFKSGEFVFAKYTNILFSNCKFIECVFENSQFNHCHFYNCLFENSDFKKGMQKDCEFQKTVFKNYIVEDSSFFNIDFVECIIENVESYNLKSEKMLIKKSNIKNSSLFFSVLKDMKILETVVVSNEVERCEIVQMVIEDSSFNNTTIFNSNFKSLSWNNNKLFKTNIIKCKGVSDEIIQDVILHNGRTQTLIYLLFKNKIFLSFFIIFFSLFVYACVSVSISKSFLYVRYIAGEVWKDPYRTDLSREVVALSKLTFNHELRGMVNKAIAFKIEGNFNRAWEIYFECISYFPKDKDKLTIYSWLINEIILVSINQEKWNMAWKSIEKRMPGEIIRDIRLLMIELLKRRYFPDVTLKIMQKFLINSGNNLKMFVEVNDVIDSVNITSVAFKFKAYQMLRSFTKRIIRDNKDSNNTYVYILENSEEWIKYYSSILERK